MVTAIRLKSYRLSLTATLSINAQPPLSEVELDNFENVILIGTTILLSNLRSKIMNNLRATGLVSHTSGKPSLSNCL